MNRTTRTSIRAEPDSYFKLVRRFPLRPIRNESEYDAATAVAEELAVRGEASLDAGESDYLDALATFISRYDDEHYQVPKDRRSAHQRLAALVREHGMSHADLAKVLGVSRPLATLLLNGKRQFQRAHLFRLGNRFKVEPGYFL